MNMKKKDNHAYQLVMERRNRNTYSIQEYEIIQSIQEYTKKENLDNVSRTKAYDTYYLRNKEIQWAFLASIVSRNAGYSMTDLKGGVFPLYLSENVQKQLFLTYERANWLIFSDAYPQLLLYEASKREGKPLFHLLQVFHVSPFMEIEWERFWITNDQKRLMTALIINEQNLIQTPVINHPVYKKKVFHSLPFRFQDWLHFSSVVFPTLEGEVYGFSAYHFQDLNERIELGKRLAWLLFHPLYYKGFRRFSNKTEHTGSRYDYEKYFNEKPIRTTPFLRMVFPIIKHKRHQYDEWYTGEPNVEKWFKPIQEPKDYDIKSWYTKKKSQLKAFILLDYYLFLKK